MKYFIIIVCISSISVSAYFINESFTLNNRLNRVTESISRIEKHQKPDSIEIYKQQFKEDAYIRELNNSVNLFLWLVAIIITVLGILSFKFFEERVKLTESRFMDSIESVKLSFSQLKNEQNDEHNKHVEKYKTLEHDIYKLDADKNSIIAALFMSFSHTFSKLPNEESSLLYEFVAIIFTLKNLVWKMENKLITEKEIGALIISLETFLEKLIKSNQVIYTSQVSNAIIYSSKLKNDTIDNLLENILSHSTPKSL